MLSIVFQGLKYLVSPLCIGNVITNHIHSAPPNCRAGMLRH